MATLGFLNFLQYMRVSKVRGQNIGPNNSRVSVKTPPTKRTPNVLKPLAPYRSSEWQNATHGSFSARSMGPCSQRSDFKEDPSSPTRMSR